VVITGDLAEHGRPEEYAILREVIGDFPLPLHLAIGNHDDRDAFLHAFADTALLAGQRQTHYVVHHRDANLIVLDSKDQASAAGRLAACPLRTPCTNSTRGRSVQVHPDERLLADLRAAQQTLDQPGCASGPRSSTPWPVGRWQGRRARSRGQRKNLFDLRRVAVVNNLHVIRQSHQPSRPPEPDIQTGLRTPTACR
jgi:hypothetical protein